MYGLKYKNALKNFKLNLKWGRVDDVIQSTSTSTSHTHRHTHV